MPTPLAIRSVIWLWLLAALWVGNSGALGRLSMTSVVGILFALTALLLLAYLRLATVREWINRLDLRGLVLLHLTRFIGLYFLVMHRRGLLSADFALRGGWGDLIVAALALPVCLLPLAPATRLRAITIWNVVGMVGLLLSVTVIGRLGLAGDPLMRNFAVLPLSLLPTFLMPLLLATHVILFLRLRQAAAPAR